MKLVYFFLILLIGLEYKLTESKYSEEIEDNEFAEFEDFEEDEEKNEKNNLRSKEEGAKRPEEDNETVLEKKMDEEEDAIVEDEVNEFEHFNDEEEFEGFEMDTPKPGKKEFPKITITEVPLYLQTSWQSYYRELLMTAGLAVYFINFFIGKSKNSKLAKMWYYTHKTLLEENFTLVGDDGKKEIEERGLMKESENLYTLWCSGRTCCEGMLVELKFLKRQDLLSVLVQMLRPSVDQIHIHVDLSKEDMDSFVFCIASKKVANRLTREMADLSAYCPEKRSGSKLGIPDNFSIMSETSEISAAMLDSKIVTILNKYSNKIEYIHFSDQYSGPKQAEETNITKLLNVKKVLIFHFNMPIQSQVMQETMEQMKPLMQLVFYCMDKVKRYRLSKESRSKVDKNRLRVEEAFLKTTHAARAEAAAARREVKKRQEKERILQEDDPEKQRKWEEKELKKQMKKKAPKTKQLKVRAI